MSSGYPIPLSVDQLMAQARAISGVDLIDHAAVEPLTVLHRSLSTESRLHEQGAIAQQDWLIRLLANRLRMRRDFDAHPEIAEQSVKGPLVVIGMARSGTTKTQKVLAATGDFNYLPLWMVVNPASFTGVPNESTAARIREADEFCKWFDAMSPETRLGHAFETFEPEEDSWLTEQSFISGAFMGYTEVPSYLEWLSRQDPVPMIEFVRDTLKYLQWQGLASADKTWLLKGPLYCGLEAQLLQVFPEGKIVMTHRTPLQTVPSACKLASCCHVPYCDAPVDVATFAGGFAVAMGQHVANHAALPPGSILDISFNDINQSFDRLLESIYAHIGLQLSTVARQHVGQWEADHPPHKQGKFRYSLEEFGLDASKLKDRMSGYFALLERLFGTIPGG